MGREMAWSTGVDWHPLCLVAVVGLLARDGTKWETLSGGRGRESETHVSGGAVTIDGRRER